MLVEDIMTRDLVSVRKEDKVQEAFEKIIGQKIRHLPVVEADGSLAGIITDRDIKGALPSALTWKEPRKRELFLSTMKVEELMTKDSITVRPSMNVQEAAKIMRKSKVGCLPVVENKKLVGIVTGIDFLDAFINLLDRERE